jgi:1,4-alpha-glucan branching enzyme
VLVDAGVGAACVELTAHFGEGSWEHLQPLAGEHGALLVPIDRATIALVWSERGYPAGGGYRDYHRLTTFHHNPWNNAGDAYDRDAALALARADAADFVARTRARLQRARAQAPGPLPAGGLVVCALDTELLGHWWYEGIHWLQAVVEECARQGLELVRLDDALERLDPVPASEWRRPLSQPAGEASFGDDQLASSWGAHGDLSTWSGPAVAEVAFALRRAELEVIAAGPRAGRVALRELLALQSSDWAFMLARGLAAPYASERLALHKGALARALADPDAVDPGAIRNLAGRL